MCHIARNTPVHLSHLEQRLRQTGASKEKSSLRLEDVKRLLEERFSTVDIKLAKKDVLPFIKDPDAVAIWSNEFFVSLLPNLKEC